MGGKIYLFFCFLCSLKYSLQITARHKLEHNMTGLTFFESVRGTLLTVQVWYMMHKLLLFPQDKTKPTPPPPTSTGRRGTLPSPSLQFFHSSSNEKRREGGVVEAGGKTSVGARVQVSSLNRREGGAHSFLSCAPPPNAQPSKQPARHQRRSFRFNALQARFPTTIVKENIMLLF